ncbi:hypothetical protein K7432_000812 [Basidiobolus ranarum]
MKGALIQLKEYYFRLHREFGRVACHIHVEKFNYVGSDGCMTFGEPHYLCRNVYVKGRLQKLSQCDQNNIEAHKELSDLSSSPSEILENIFSQQGDNTETPANDTCEVEMMQTDSLLGVSVGWKDLRKITERDCIISANQQELLDNLEDWRIEEDIRENLEDLDSFNWCTQIRTSPNESLAATQSGSPKSPQSPSSIESFSIPVEYGEEIYESQSDIELSEVTSFPSAESESVRTGENQTTASMLFGDNFCSQPIELRLIPLNKLIETKKLDFTNDTEDENNPSKQQAIGRPNDRLYEVSYESSPAELAADFARYLIKNDHDQLNQHLSYIRRDSAMRMMDSFGALRRVSPESPNVSMNIVDIDTIAQKEPEFDPIETEMTPREKLHSIANDNLSKFNHKGKERNLLAITRIGEGIKWNLPGFENPTSLKELGKVNSTSIENTLHADPISSTNNVLGKDIADSVTSSVERLRKTCDDYGSGLIKDSQDMAPITQIMPMKFNLIELAEDIEESHCTQVSEGELSSQESYIDSSILAKSSSSENPERSLFREDFKASKRSKDIEESSVTSKLSMDLDEEAGQNENTIYIEVDGPTTDEVTPTKQNGGATTSGYYRELRKVFSISWLAKKRKRDPLAEDPNEW